MHKLISLHSASLVKILRKRLLLLPFLSFASSSQRMDMCIVPVLWNPNGVAAVPEQFPQMASNHLMSYLMKPRNLMSIDPQCFFEFEPL